MLFALIPIAWLTIVAFVVLACRSAARGDALMAQSDSANDEGSSATNARTRWQDGPGTGTRGLRVSRSGAVVRGRGGRGRGAQCPTT
jgi:hypothetical protein